jgi:transketolase C-terminal domain/subunit
MLPGMKVYSPGDAKEIELVMERRLGNSVEKGPAYIRLGKSGEPVLPEADCNKSDLRINNNLRFLKKNKESKTLIISYGVLVNRVLQVSLLLEESQDLLVDVASMPILFPFNWVEIVDDIKAYDLICVVEEHQDVGSIGMQFAANENLNKKTILRINLDSRFIKHYGTYEQVLDSAGLSIKEIASRIFIKSSHLNEQSIT